MGFNKLISAPIMLNHVYIGNDKEFLNHDRHFHPYWELKVYLVNDQLRVVINPPNQVHSGTPYPQLQAGWTIHFQQPMLNLSLFSSDTIKEDYFISWNMVDSLCPGTLTELIEALVRAKDKYADEQLFNALLSTLTATVSYVLQNQNAHSLDTSSLTDKAKFYIERNYYKTSLSVESVAKNIGVTAGHLANLFQKEKLPTLRQYIVKVRLEHALRLLRSKCYTVKEVANMTGWNCQFYFSNSFKKKYGVTPSQAATHIKDESYIQE